MFGVPEIEDYVNTNGYNCGQAAVATTVAHYGLPVHPEIPRDRRGPDGRMYPANNPFVNAVMHDYPPTGTIVGLSHWSWKEDLERAYRGYGFKGVGVGFSKPYGDGREQWDEVCHALRDGVLVTVMLDMNVLGYPGFFEVHWSVLHYFDGRSVYLSNMGSEPRVELSKFMDSWHCAGFPAPNNYVYVWAKP